MVEPVVKTISSGLAAPRKRAMVPRVASYFSVAMFERVCRPRWTLAYSSE